METETEEVEEGDSESEDEEEDEEDEEYEEDEEDEEDEEGVEGDANQTSLSTGGIRPKGFTDNKSVIPQPPKQTPQNRSQRPPVVHAIGNRGRMNLKGHHQGGDPSQASTPNTSPQTGQTPPPTPAGMSFEVLPFILF